MCVPAAADPSAASASAGDVRPKRHPPPVARRAAVQPPYAHIARGPSPGAAQDRSPVGPSGGLGRVEAGRSEVPGRDGDGLTLTTLPIGRLGSQGRPHMHLGQIPKYQIWCEQMCSQLACNNRIISCMTMKQCF